jgi:ZIP family zinc transporter
VLTGCAFLGPLAAFLGYSVLGAHEPSVSVIMLAAAGGILYLTFQDIAPQARLDRAWGPPLGAVVGFLAGVMGHMMLGAG